MFNKTNEVIDEHIDMGNGAQVEEEWRPGLRSWMAGREHKRFKHETSALLGGDHRIAQGGDHQIPRREHEHFKLIAGALPGGDHWIS